MKKLTFTLALVMVMMLAKAQITITSSDMPRPGREDLVGNDTLHKSLNFGTPSSSAQVFDFSSLVSSYPKFAIYSPTTPYQAYAHDFPGANLYTWGPSFFFTSFYGGAPVYANNYGYMYWKTDSAGFSIVGFRGNVGGPYGYQNVKESPQELLMGTPATYGSAFTDSARWEVTFHLNDSLTITNWDTNYISKRKKTLTCDAFGTITTPYVSSLNVIRVHEYITDIDSITSYCALINYTYSTLFIEDTLNNYQFWAKGVHYPIAIVHCDKNNKIMSTEYLADTLGVYSITGNVFDSSGARTVKKGTANLIFSDKTWFHISEWLETVDIDTNGHFQFADVPYIALDAYIVQANPDTNKYPYLEPTYYGDSIFWLSATPLSVTRDTNITIHCQSDSLTRVAMGIGTGSISGSVWSDTSHTAMVSRGVKVVLVENPGGACRVAHTNSNGDYNFTDLPTTGHKYKLVVDIPGTRFYDTTYSVTLTSSSPHFTNLDFKYDTTYIYIYEGAGIVEHNINNLYDVNIYPNPFTNTATVYVSNPNSENRLVTLKVYDITGRVLKEESIENSEYLTISSEGMAKGMYIYEIQVNKEIVNSGKLIVD